MRSNMRLPPPSRSVLSLLLMSLHPLLTGCESDGADQNEHTCHELLREGRVDLKEARLPAARAKLASAEATCAPRKKPYVDQFRDELMAREEAVRKEAERAAAEAKKRLEQPIGPFMEWVRTRSTTGQADDQAECYERGDPRFGWCHASHRVVETAEFRSLFLRTDPRTFRFSVAVGSPIVCDDLGEHRVVRSWRVNTEGAKATRRTHCALLSKTYRGLSALVSVTGEHSEVDVFNQSYLDNDTSFAEMLRREGR